MRTVVCLLPMLLVTACVGDDSSNPPKDSGAETSAEAGVDAPADVGPADVATTCEAGTADCDPNVAGCETTLATDDKNCGACGHDCGGTGLCQAGVCAPQTIASNVATPVSLSVSGSSVFWLVDQEVQRCPVTGCSGFPGDVGDGVHVPQNWQASPWFITADSQNVYWVGYTSDPSQNQIFRCPVAGCGGNSPPAIATGDNYSLTLVGNTANLYWLNSNNALITRVRKSDSNSVSLPGTSNLLGMFDLATDDKHLLVTNPTAPVNGGGVWVCDATTDCSSTSFTLLLDTATNVATNGALAFVSQQATGNIVSCDVANGCSGSGTPITPGETGVVAMTADANAVYWAIKGTGSNGTIRACTLPSCAGGPRTLASGQALPRSIVNDANFVYWANQGATTNSGSIMRVRK